MFHLEEPRYLWLLLLLPLLLWRWLAQRRAALRHPTADLLARFPQGRGRLAFWTGTGLRVVALLCMIAALARPRWPDLKTRMVTEGIAIVMVVDVSGSMATRDFEGPDAPTSRLQAVKDVFRLFVEGGETAGGHRLEGRPTDLVGLVVFGTRPDTACPLTLSHSALLKALDEQLPRSVPGESETNVSDALVVGIHRLRHAGPRRKVLILLSDGEHNVPAPPSTWTPRQAARVAAGLGIAVYAIDAGGTGVSLAEAGAPAASVEAREAGIKTLRELAHLSGGEYFRADNTAALAEVYRAIDSRERASIESFQYRRYHEGYPWLSLAGLVLFVTALLLEMTVWRRVP
jgi:Ca-activated chloride channel family protein